MKWVLLFIFPQMVWAINNCSDGWRIASGSNKIVNCHGICWDITNNHASGYDIFVPTRTTNEYNSFIASTPAGVTKTTCVTYLPWYPQLNVPVSTVTNGGWEECFKLAYNSTASRASVETACNKDRVMMACRPTGNSTLTLLGQATRQDVFFPTATIDDGNYTYPAWGVGWYYGTKSIGFAYNQDTVSRSSCDNPSSGNLNYRLCRHSNSTTINTGWRCGTNTSLSTGWETVWYHANGADPTDECNDYKTIQDYNTRYYRQTGQSPLYCDGGSKNAIGDKSAGYNPSPITNGGWHKFFNASGVKYRIPNVAVKRSMAHTSAVGWIEGADPVNGAKNTRTAWFSWISDGENNSKWGNKTGIETRSCADGSLVYKLQTTSCSYRYSMIPHNERASQCYTYDTISDTTRHTNYGRVNPRCDNRETDGGPIWDWGSQGVWFYFSTGSRTVPHSAPPVNRCDTSAPGWLNFASPGSLGTTSGQGCFTWTAGGCHFTLPTASQTECNGYNVYQLPRPPSCTLRWCVDP